MQRPDAEDPANTTAHAQGEALEQIDIIVSDIVLPNIDGVTMAQQLRERRPGRP